MNHFFSSETATFATQFEKRQLSVTQTAQNAGVVKLVDTPDLGSGAARLGGSSPSTRTSLFSIQKSMATINREPIAPLHEKITVTVSTSDYNSTYESSLKKYAKSANIPGFRKGMVPTGVVKIIFMAHAINIFGAV